MRNIIPAAFRRKPTKLEVTSVAAAATIALLALAPSSEAFHSTADANGQFRVNAPVHLGIEDAASGQFVDGTNATLDDIADNLDQGANVAKTVTLKNLGQQAIILDSAQITGDGSAFDGSDPAVVKFDADPTSTVIQPGATLDVPFHLTTDASWDMATYGATTGTVSVHFDAEDTGSAPKPTQTVDVTDEASFDSAYTAGDNIRLTSDIVWSSTAHLAAGAPLTVDLNGHTFQVNDARSGGSIDGSTNVVTWKNSASTSDGTAGTAVTTATALASATGESDLSADIVGGSTQISASGNPTIVLGTHTLSDVYLEGGAFETTTLK